MTWLGFLITTPFATVVFIYDLKGNSEVKLLPSILIALLVTAGLYAMFVFGFQVKLPAGILFS
ncbi:MAG: tripartite tricarboxylate transporter TctB family protein [Lachnospiraceae bacterium]